MTGAINPFHSRSVAARRRNGGRLGRCEHGGADDGRYQNRCDSSEKACRKHDRTPPTKYPRPSARSRLTLVTGAATRSWRGKALGLHRAQRRTADTDRVERKLLDEG